MTPQPPTLEVATVAYDMTAHHDLLARHRLFGLTAARDSTRGHFPGISGSPLAIGSARQSATARFGALGFLAVHRTSRLVLAAGWVTEPVPHPGYEDEEEEEYAHIGDATHT